MTKYVLTMTEEQARLVIRALDFFSRMRIGQFGELVGLVLSAKDGDIDDYKRRRDEASRILLEARDVLMPELRDIHSSCGVCAFNDSRAAWHTLQALRSCIAWHKNPEGGWMVDFDRPSGDAPTVEAVEDAKCRNDKQ